MDQLPAPAESAASTSDSPPQRPVRKSAANKGKQEHAFIKDFTPVLHPIDSRGIPLAGAEAAAHILDSFLWSPVVIDERFAYLAGIRRDIWMVDFGSKADLWSQVVCAY